MKRKTRSIKPTVKKTVAKNEKSKTIKKRFFVPSKGTTVLMEVKK